MTRSPTRRRRDLRRRARRADRQARDRERQGAVVDVDPRATRRTRKLTSSLNFSRGLVVATTGGYIGRRTALSGTRRHAQPHDGHISTSGTRLLGPAPIIQRRRARRSTRRSGRARARSCSPERQPARGDRQCPYTAAPTSAQRIDCRPTRRHWSATGRRRTSPSSNVTDADLGSTAPHCSRAVTSCQGRQGRLPAPDPRSLRAVQTVPTPGSTCSLLGARDVAGEVGVVASGSGNRCVGAAQRKAAEACRRTPRRDEPVVAGEPSLRAGQRRHPRYRHASGHELAQLPCGSVHCRARSVDERRCDRRRRKRERAPHERHTRIYS